MDRRGRSQERRELPRPRSRSCPRFGAPERMPLRGGVAPFSAGLVELGWPAAFGQRKIGQRKIVEVDGGRPGSAVRKSCSACPPESAPTRSRVLDVRRACSPGAAAARAATSVAVPRPNSPQAHLFFQAAEAPAPHSRLLFERPPLRPPGRPLLLPLLFSSACRSPHDYADPSRG